MSAEASEVQREVDAHGREAEAAMDAFKRDLADCAVRLVADRQDAAQYRLQTELGGRLDELASRLSLLATQERRLEERITRLGVAILGVALLAAIAAVLAAFR